MVVTSATIYVKPENVDDLIRASTENHHASIGEPGNMRFDVLRSMTDPTRFLLYRTCQSEAEGAERKRTNHYLKWKENVDSWMAKARDDIPRRIICPQDRNKW